MITSAQLHFATLRRQLSMGAVFLAGYLAVSAQAQSIQAPIETLDLPSTVTHIIIPQHRVIAIRGTISQGVALVGVDADIVIRERFARTTLDMTVENPSSTLAEAILLVPIPAGATVHGFSFSAEPNQPASASEGVARIMPREDARRLYDSIVRASRDPGLLEFAGSTMLRSSVFPIAPRTKQRVRIVWEELLPLTDGRIDYALPRSESLRQSVPWTVRLGVAQVTPIAAVYSPSHGIVEVLHAATPNERHFALDALSQKSPGPFLVSVLNAKDDSGVATAATSIAAYPDPTQGGGYFMLLGGIAAPTIEASSMKREVTIVLDRSGSMAGGKLDQAKAAVLQVIEGLSTGERFNIVDYSNAVGLFAREPVLYTPQTVNEARAHLASLKPSGGTNISDALVEALRQPHVDGTLGIVLFLTDGLPTVGQTSERAIREIVEKGNPHNRRVYTIGVGADVNVPLLDRVADLTRARATYIVPGENVELKVAQVARQLDGPTLADIALTARSNDGNEDTKRIRDLAPRRIPDVFAGEQLVVFGAYVGESPTQFEITARSAAGAVKANVPFDPSAATTRHGYVARLWATRRIAELVDEVRQFAADVPGQPLASATPMNDPRVKELVEEIVKLSARFGVLTEYTAFFADQGTNLGDWNALAGGCSDLLDSRAVATRSGGGALNQGINFNEMKGKAQLAYDNRFYDEQLREKRVTNVQQLSDRCFYQNDGVWLDSQLIAATAAAAVPTLGAMHVDETVEFGSHRHFELINELAREGRQSVLSLPGDTLIRHQSKNILVRNPLEPAC